MTFDKTFIYNNNTSYIILAPIRRGYNKFDHTFCAAPFVTYFGKQISRYRQFYIIMKLIFSVKRRHLMRLLMFFVNRRLLTSLLFNFFYKRDLIMVFLKMRLLISCLKALPTILGRKALPLF